MYVIKIEEKSVDVNMYYITIMNLSFKTYSLTTWGSPMWMRLMLLETC